MIAMFTMVLGAPAQPLLFLGVWHPQLLRMGQAHSGFTVQAASWVTFHPRAMPSMNEDLLAIIPNPLSPFTRQ